MIISRTNPLIRVFIKAMTMSTYTTLPSMTAFSRWSRAALLPFLAATLALGGCAATTRTLDPEAETHYDARYDFSDKKQIVDELTGSLLSSAAVSTEVNKPLIVVYGVDNETSEHINTGGITDDIRLALINSGEYRFLNRAQRTNIQVESEYQQAGFVPPSQRIVQGRQLGADYILSGTLRSIEKKQPRQWRLNKKELIYYSMNLELTNLESGEISWADNVEIAREASQPLFRW